MVRLPDAAEQVRNAPVRVLRGLFAGIGQLLLAADRLRAEEAAEQAAGAAAEKAAEKAAAEKAAAAKAERERAADHGQRGARTFRSLDSTGNVRLLSPDEIAASPGTAASPAPDQPQRIAKPASAKPASAKPARPRSAPAMTAPATAAPATTAPATTAPATTAPAKAAAATTSSQPGQPDGAAGLPVPGYDRLTLPSLRSRLRQLSVAQLRELAEYEAAHAARADVLTMFERRIAKLDTAGADGT